MKSFIEGVKEFFRISIIAGISYLLTAGVLASIISLFGAHLSVEQQAAIVTVLTFILKSVDKWLHEFGKNTNNTTMLKGLVRF